MSEELNFPARVSRGPGDEILRMLARITAAELSMSITLVVPGGVLTGTLISRDKWYKKWLAEINEAGQWGELFSSTLEKVTSNAGMYVLDNELPQKDRPSTLHLENARIISGNTPVGPCLLRVRLDTVSAWTNSVRQPPE